MKLKITEQIHEKYPDLAIGVVIAHNVANRKSDEVLEQFKKEAESKLRNSEWTTERLPENPCISSWREIYRSFGINPKKYSPTAEALIKRVLKGNSLPQISVIVDTYLAVELAYFLPIGGYDLDTINGDIVLRFSQGSELFAPIGGGSKETSSDDVVYGDDNQVLTIHWNFLDCDATKITLDTKSFILCMEMADSKIPLEKLEKATLALRQTLEKFCPGDYKSFIANTNESLSWDI
ncbi:MAG: phenylalanine--tRNA ligase beta subunit-related protein [Patescibacteria group bacterium]